jgi:hypothetical protein
MKVFNKNLILMITTVWICISLLVIFGFGAAQPVDPMVVLNEFMASNTVTIINPAGNYSDWIELFNPSDLAVDLGGMFLTDNLTSLRWQFSPDTIIDGHGHFIVWADGNVMQGSMHTSFKLNANGGTIALIASDGSTFIDTVTYKQQFADMSFGRTNDGDSGWRYLSNPTPGEANIGGPTFFSGYPWQLWVVLLVAIVVCGVTIFRDKIRLRKTQP